MALRKEETMKKNAKTNRQIIDEYDYSGKFCSFQDCTGLIPFTPETEAELESYEDIYPYLPPGNLISYNKFSDTPDAP